MITDDRIDTVVRAALEEDCPRGDATSELLVPVAATATGSIVARESGVLSGTRVLLATGAAVDPQLRITLNLHDGHAFERGASIATVSGSARSILRAERVALNLLQRLSGIASLTARFVSLVDGTPARILDTRKTTPGLRPLERDAVRAGGGHNHRFSLSDAVLVKDNHFAILAACGEHSLTDTLKRARSRVSPGMTFEVEVDRIDQIEPVLAAGVDTIMFDNFSLDELRASVALVAGRATVEASGNITLATVSDVARTGVDTISVGALTHSPRALDLGLDLEIGSVTP